MFSVSQCIVNYRIRVPFIVGIGWWGTSSSVVFSVLREPLIFLFLLCSCPTRATVQCCPDCSHSNISHPQIKHTFKANLQNVTRLTAPEFQYCITNKKAAQIISYSRHSYHRMTRIKHRRIKLFCLLIPMNRKDNTLAIHTWECNSLTHLVLMKDESSLKVTFSVIINVMKNALQQLRLLLHIFFKSFTCESNDSGAQLKDNTVLVPQMMSASKLYLSNWWPISWLFHQTITNY
jgi:hypothetical protein